jgi:hypothetical protein
MPKDPKIPIIKPDSRLTTQVVRQVITTTGKNGPVLGDGKLLAITAAGTEMPAVERVALTPPAVADLPGRSLLTGLRPETARRDRPLPAAPVMAELGGLKAKRPTGQVMPKVSSARSTGLATIGNEVVPMRPVNGRKRGEDAPVAGAGYVRILASVVDGEIVLRDLAHVEGELADPEPLFGGVGYEVVLDGKHIHAGDVPDPGVRRGFAPPDDPNRGHSFVAVEDFDFVIRIPLAKVPPGRIPDLAVSVFQIHGESVLARVGDTPLTKQFAGQVRQVAQVPALTHASLARDAVRGRVAAVTGERLAGAFTKVR